MPKSRKRKLRRLESKYRSFNQRTLITFLFVAFVLFLAGLSFAPEKMALADKAEVSPLLYFAFIWTGLICMQLCGQFVLGTLRAQAEKQYGPLMWQSAWAIVFVVAGVSVVYYGLQGYLV